MGIWTLQEFPYSCCLFVYVHALIKVTYKVDNSTSVYIARAGVPSCGHLLYTVFFYSLIWLFGVRAVCCILYKMYLCTSKQHTRFLGRGVASVLPGSWWDMTLDERRVSILYAHTHFTSYLPQVWKGEASVGTRER